MLESIPKKLKRNEPFCLWRRESGRKIPYQINGSRASVSDPSTFASFSNVIKALDGYDGIGVLTTKYTKIDIDDCVKDGELSPLAEEVISTIDSYTELSPSGTGIHIFCHTPGLDYDKTRYYVNNRKIHMEIYVPGHTDRFFTVTGNAVRSCDINDRTAEVQMILDKYMLRPVQERNNSEAPGSFLSDEAVVSKAASSKQGYKFTALWSGNWHDIYGSQSEADLALASILAFWCGGDREQMDRLFRQSGLYRRKWDERHGAKEYGEITIDKAISTCAEFYAPLPPVNAADDFNDVLQKLKDVSAADNPRYKHGDIGKGRLFADIYKDIARYVPERKMYFVYDGIRWTPDIGNLKTMELCKDLSDALLLYAAEINDEAKRNFFAESSKKWYARRSREIYLKEAQSIYPISASSFDTSKYLLNCNNGTLDLETGEFRDHDPKDHITKLAPVDYDPSADSARFRKFISEITCEDEEIARFLQKCLGYSISGDTRFECLFFIYGSTTRNGKGTLLESILHVLGDYGRAVRPETIAQKNSVNSQGPSEDIARLAGLRFVNIAEPKQGMVLNAAQVKSMTGNDTLNARFLHENSFDFKPQFKIYINTNYLPAVTDMTLFSSGRIIVIPFNRHFEEWEQDRTLKDEFSKPEVQSAILNWLIEGYQILYEEGFNVPPAVVEATGAYSRENDKIQQFADECLEKDETQEVKTTDVYSAYRIWCASNGYHVENRKNFNQALRTIGVIERKRPKDGGEKTTVLVGQILLVDPEFL